MGKTSQVYPLQIATIVIEQGAVGVTFCPGRRDARAMNGPWDRDLALDLDAIQRWGAKAVVSVIEQHELDGQQVPQLGQAILARGMQWLHLPVVDVQPPDSAADARWMDMRNQVHDIIGRGGRVLFHCRGGLGRSGTMAARTLVERGWTAAAAIAAVRKARRGAIETPDQEAYVFTGERLRWRPQPAPPRARPAGLSREDRAMGALLGLAVGDALGTTLEFNPRDSYPPLTDMIGGGPFRLRAGQWTDDTAMALALADSLVAHPTLNEADLMDRFVDWWQRGTYSCTSRCFDIGTTTSAALSAYRATGNPLAGSTNPRTAGNGSLMRLSPVAILHADRPAAAADLARRQSCTTHGAPEAVEACAAYARLLCLALQGADKEAVLSAGLAGHGVAVDAILAGSWRGKVRSQIRASGYVLHSLEAALWCIAQAADFREAVLLAANLGEDADTTAAIAGQLAGALWGASGIPKPWLARLAWRERLEAAVGELLGRARDL